MRGGRARRARRPPRRLRPRGRARPGSRSASARRSTPPRSSTVVDLLDREQLRHGLAAVLLQRAAQRPTYDVLFDLWWPLSRPAGPRRRATTPTARTADAGRVDAATCPVDDADLRRARCARELLRAAPGRRRGGAAPVRPAGRRPPRRAGSRRRRGSRSSATGCCGRCRRTRWSPSCWPACSAEGDRGGLAEQVARQTVGSGIAAFRAAVEAEVRRRTAAEKGRDKVAKNAVRPLADQVDFLRAQPRRPGRAAARGRPAGPPARRPALRPAPARARGPAGLPPDRAGVAGHRRRAAGDPPPAAQGAQAGARRALRRQRLGGRVRHFTLMLTQALREHFTRCGPSRSSTPPTRSPGSSAGRRRRRRARADRRGRPTSSASTGTATTAHAFEVFADRWPRAVGPEDVAARPRRRRAPTTAPPGLPVLADLVRRSRSAHWLNPEPRRLWGSGDSAADRYGEVIDMVECRNAAQLAEFVTTL